MERVSRASRLKPRYIFCLDFGQSRDYTARAVLERSGQAPARYAVRDLARYPLQTPYQQIAMDTAEKWESPPVRKFERDLVVDATGVGRPVLEMLEEKGLSPVPITITGGYDVTRGRGLHGIEYRVPKRDLAMTVQMLLQSGRLTISSQLKLADTLRKELLAFRVKITKSGHDTYEAWREKDHDDLVLALACGLWWAEYELMDTPDTSGPRPEYKPLGDF